MVVSCLICEGKAHMRNEQPNMKKANYCIAIGFLMLCLSDTGIAEWNGNVQYVFILKCMMGVEHPLLSFDQITLEFGVKKNSCVLFFCRFLHRNQKKEFVYRVH